MAFPDVGVPKDAAYFAFWQLLAWCAAAWGLSVIVLLVLIWHALEARCGS